MILEILRLAQLAPSAGNLQAYKVRILKSREEKEKLKQATFSKQESIVSAPVAFLICADAEESGKRYMERGENLYSIQDATIFTAYVQLAIASLGLVSVWVGAFSEAEVINALSLPKNLRPVAIVPFGYADGEPKERVRKNLEEIII